MRDLVAREALRTMARDAAKRFRELVASGQEIPYDVREPGEGSPLPQYVPLTERFVRDHASALLELDSFGSACAAIESADLAGPYLEEFGIAVPPDARKRAELAGVVFLCRLWADSTDFSLDGDRLTAAIAELEAGGEAADDEIEVVVPLRGLQMPVVRLELATATIVRADTVEVPPEARVAEGLGAAGWEPTFLAATSVGASEPGGQDGERKPDAGARAVDAFRQLITALRLFKAGGVGLGPHAWTRATGDRWRRIATGAGRPRAGGYRLAEEELGELAAFSRALAYRSTPFGPPATGTARGSGALARAISRFEAGLERNVVLEALNDCLLSLRFVLEGGGPAELGLAMRVAALCAEPERREETKAIVNRALALERELWSGEPAPAAEGAPTPAETAVVVEDLVRAILKDAACGHLGADLRSAADEILLADGLAVGDGAVEQRGGTDEWDVAEQEGEPAEEAEEMVADDGPLDDMPAPAVQEELWLELQHPEAEEPGEEAAVQVPEPARRIRSEPVPEPEEDNVTSEIEATERERRATTVMGVAPEQGRSRVAELLEERPGGPRKTADRVAYLFPRPETTEWDVRELSYERRRRSELTAS
jgi:hypothetical protein